MLKPDPFTHSQIAQKLYPDSRFVRAWALGGGISAQMTAVEIEAPLEGSTEMEAVRFIVRQPGEATLKANPQVALDEFWRLDLANTLNLRAPAPLLYDATKDILPHTAEAISRQRRSWRIIIILCSRQFQPLIVRFEARYAIALLTRTLADLIFLR